MVRARSVMLPPQGGSKWRSRRAQAPVPIRATRRASLRSANSKRSSSRSSGNSGHMTRRGFEGAVVSGVVRRRKNVEDETHRVVLEDSGRLSVAVALDGAAGHVGRVPRDACELERQAIRESHVPVEPVDPHGIFRRELVDHRAMRKLTAPKLMIPIAPGDPRPWRDGVSELSDASGKFFGSVGIAQLHRGELETAVEEVDMRVDEARNDESSRGVDDTRLSNSRADRNTRANRHDATALDENRLRGRVVGIAGPDFGIQQSEASGLPLALQPAGGDKGEENNKQECTLDKHK